MAPGCPLRPRMGGFTMSHAPAAPDGPVMAYGGASSHRPSPQFSPTARPEPPDFYAATASSTCSETAKSTNSGNATGIAPRIMMDALLAASCNDLVDRWA